MRLLVVEDEKKIADSIKKGLSQESFAVDVAYTGTDGYDLASSEEYDLLILDIMLPGMDGLTLCKTLRAENIVTPILMLTAKGQVSDKVKGLEIGADDYLVKPFAFEELVARTKALLRRPTELINEQIHLADLMLDATNRQATRSKKPIELSAKEYALLEYLMRNKNRVVSKEQIMQHVWDYDADILPNTIEVYIGYLRNKIDKPFHKSHTLIHTVRGFGYKIGL